MKKWLLISTILNILILQIPLSKNNKATKVKESINLDLTRINFKTNNSVQKNRVSNSDNNLFENIFKNFKKYQRKIWFFNCCCI